MSIFLDLSRVLSETFSSVLNSNSFPSSGSFSDSLDLSCVFTEISSLEDESSERRLAICVDFSGFESCTLRNFQQRAQFQFIPWLRQCYQNTFSDSHCVFTEISSLEDESSEWRPVICVDFSGFESSTLRNFKQCAEFQFIPWLGKCYKNTSGVFLFSVYLLKFPVSKADHASEDWSFVSTFLDLSRVLPETSSSMFNSNSSLHSGSVTKTRVFRSEMCSYWNLHSPVLFSQWLTLSHSVTNWHTNGWGWLHNYADVLGASCVFTATQVSDSVSPNLHVYSVTKKNIKKWNDSSESCSVCWFLEASCVFTATLVLYSASPNSPHITVSQRWSDSSENCSLCWCSGF